VGEMKKNENVYEKLRKKKNGNFFFASTLNFRVRCRGNEKEWKCLRKIKEEEKYKFFFRKKSVCRKGKNKGTKGAWGIEVSTIHGRGKI
jgi:hypothetical protein